MHWKVSSPNLPLPRVLCSYCDRNLCTCSSCRVPLSTLTGIPTCSSYSSTALNETYVVGQEESGCVVLDLDSVRQQSTSKAAKGWLQKPTVGWPAVPSGSDQFLLFLTMTITRNQTEPSVSWRLGFEVTSERPHHYKIYRVNQKQHINCTCGIKWHYGKLKKWF